MLQQMLQSLAFDKIKVSHKQTTSLNTLEIQAIMLKAEMWGNKAL